MRSPLNLIIAASFALIACEDGPTQIYNPAPAGAGNTWNNGNTPGTVDPAQQSYTGVLGGANKMEICSGPEKATVWANMVKQPITPPRYAAGLDLAGGNTWAGITIEDAERGLNGQPKLCQSTNAGDQFGDGTQVNYWGDNGEVWMDYRVSNHKAYFMTFWPGYIGTMDFKTQSGPDGKPHTYQIAIQSQVLKDGKPFTLDWIGNKGANFVAQGDEIYRALLETYAPGLPQDPQGVTCTSTGRCIKGSFGDVAYFYIPAIGWALWIDNQNAAQPTPSIPTRLDQNLAKLLPYAFALPTLKMDAEGPIANAGQLGKAASPCKLKIGLTYADFLANCVQVTGVQATDQNELNKLLGGLSHGDERYHFDVQGVDVEFTAESLPPMDVIHDKDSPKAGDHSTSFVVDQSTLGKIQNDYDANGKRDLHGAGAVQKEYLRLVRANLLAGAGIADGDTSKCINPPNGVDINTFIAGLPKYCTGFEGMVSAAQGTANDPNNIGYPATNGVSTSYRLGLKLGHQKLAFCWDATGDIDRVKGTINSGYQTCTVGDTFSTSYARVLQVFGRGKVANLPLDAQDVRFFFKMWTTALIKYFQVGGQAAPVPDLANLSLDPDSLFFDSIGAGQFEIAEYIDRRFTDPVDPLLTPTDFRFTADVRNGIVDGYTFTRDLLRGETAVYDAIRENPADGLGKESNGLLTNIFGSPVLKSGWTASKQGKSAYYCATTMDPANCDNQTPPTDAKGNVLLDNLGRPILAPYPGAFGSTAFSLGVTPIKIMQTFDNIQQAWVRVPIHQDPYDPASTLGPALNILIPWLPKQPGVGFPIPLSGMLDKFVTTAQLDFSGTQITANIDYDAVLDPVTHQPMKNGQIQFLAVETTDFLGDVFLCQDSNTGDLLRARMYSSVATLLQWFADHPGSYQSCGIIIRYSPFGNFADYVTSLQNGVHLNITQGGGYGRVVDVTLFVPGQ